jgi:hypothetical protein
MRSLAFAVYAKAARPQLPNHFKRFGLGLGPDVVPGAMPGVKKEGVQGVGLENGRVKAEGGSEAVGEQTVMGRRAMVVSAAVTGAAKISMGGIPLGSHGKLPEASEAGEGRGVKRRGSEVGDDDDDSSDGDTAAIPPRLAVFEPLCVLDSTQDDVAPTPAAAADVGGSQGMGGGSQGASGGRGRPPVYGGGRGGGGGGGIGGAGGSGGNLQRLGQQPPAARPAMGGAASRILASRGASPAPASPGRYR